MNKGCNHCKHHISTLNFNPDCSIGKSTYDCLLGHTEKTNEWWINNSHKREESELDKMDCFEETETSKILSEMSDILDKIKTELNK